MKKTIFFLLIFISVLSSCKKDAECDLSPICQETVPTDEACLAYFERWFYDANSKSCQEIGYSGCSQKGFETKVECEECDCD